MSFYDDHYEEFLIEEVAFRNTASYYCSTKSDNEVVQDALQNFRRFPDIDEDHEQLAKDILITVARIKRLSQKQKMRLVMFLIERGDEAYEVFYDDYPKLA